MGQVSRPLIVKKEIPVTDSQEMLFSLDMALAEYYCNEKDFEKGLKLYNDLLPRLVEPERTQAVNKYINFSLQYAQT